MTSNINRLSPLMVNPNSLEKTKEAFRGFELNLETLEKIAYVAHNVLHSHPIDEQEKQLGISRHHIEGEVILYHPNVGLWNPKSSFAMREVLSLQLSSLLKLYQLGASSREAILMRVPKEEFTEEKSYYAYPGGGTLTLEKRIFIRCMMHRQDSVMLDYFNCQSKEIGGIALNGPQAALNFLEKEFDTHVYASALAARVFYYARPNHAISDAIQQQIASNLPGMLSSTLMMRGSSDCSGQVTSLHNWMNTYYNTTSDKCSVSFDVCYKLVDVESLITCNFGRPLTKLDHYPFNYIVKHGLYHELGEGAHAIDSPLFVSSKQIYGNLNDDIKMCSLIFTPEGAIFMLEKAANNTFSAIHLQTGHSYHVCLCDSGKLPAGNSRTIKCQNLDKTFIFEPSVF